MEITYTSHVEVKFKILERHGKKFTKEQIEEVLRHPETVTRGYKNRHVAQKPINETHLLRVIYEKRDTKIMVVTFYPARRERYEG